VNIFKNKYTFPVLSLLVIIAGAAPRAIEIINRNYLFLFDQGAYYQAVRDIVVNRHLSLIGTEVGGIGGFFQGPGFYYLLTIPFILFKGDPYGGMLLMFILGLLAIALSIVLFHKSLGKTAALLIAFFIALSPGIIHQSRFIWPPFVIAPLTVVFLYFIWQSYRKKPMGIPLAFFIVGLMTHFEIATSITLFISTAITFLLIRPKDIFKPKTIILSAILLTATQATLILFDLRHNFLNIKGILKFVTHGSSGAAYSFQNHLDVYRDSIFSVAHNWNVAAVLSGIVILGLVLIFKDKKTNPQLKKFILFLLINPIILFIVLLPMKSTLWAWWFLELPIMFCFLLGISLVYLFRHPKLKFVAVLIVIGYFALFATQTYGWYKNDLNDYGGVAKIKGKIDAIDYIYKDANSKDFNLLIFTPPVYTYPYDYLLWWYGQKKYGYIPGKEKKGTFYLIIEPDPQKQWSYKGWLETVIKTGKVESTVTLSSGTIIQKRVEE